MDALFIGRTALSGQPGVCVISAQAETTEVPGTSVAKPARTGGRSECDSGVPHGGTQVKSE